ncbi:MAG: hypothetical protein IJ688_03570 [Treponema sp.]|nr:hypothetical protein [Treponema sp.]
MSETFSFITKESIRLDDYLRKMLPGAVGQRQAQAQTQAQTQTQAPSSLNLSNSKIRRLILAGCVKVNGRVLLRPAFELRGTSSVEVFFDREKFFYEKKPDDIKFSLKESDILFEDDNLIFVNKPAFFPVEQTVAGNRANLHDAVVDFLWARNKELRNPPYVGIMHRLDRETSGVIVFTKNRNVNKEIHDIFEKHEQDKEYIALCVPEHPKGGCPVQGTSFTVEKFMGRISGKSQAGKWGELSEYNGGQYSKTDFYVEGETAVEGKACLKIKCMLYTGRTHQIRVHLSGEGLPILGDALYGGRPADRLYLHAYRLSFICSGRLYDIIAPLPW